MIPIYFAMIIAISLLNTLILTALLLEKKSQRRHKYKAHPSPKPGKKHTIYTTPNGTFTVSEQREAVYNDDQALFERERDKL